MIRRLLVRRANWTAAHKRGFSGNGQHGRERSSCRLGGLTVRTIDDFVGLLQDELGLAVTAEDIDRELDQVVGWDSMQLLALLRVLERRTGRAISLPDVLEASSLGRIYAVAVRG
jgi:hypothetical protein